MRRAPGTRRNGPGRGLDRAIIILGDVLPLALALTLIALFGTPQSGSAPQTASSRTVLATVLDARNRAVVDVGVDDFVVQEAGQAREVLDVRVADYPIVLLIDNGAAARTDFEAIRKAAARFIARIGQRPLALGTIGDPPAMLTTFEDERSVVTGKLAQMTAEPSADSMVFQAVANAGRMIHETGAPFSAIVVLSATAMDATRQSPGTLVEQVLESGAIVHVVGKRYTGNRPEGFAARNAEMLHALADQTRGQFTTIYSGASFQVALDRLADRLTTEMMIQYIVPPGGASVPNDVKVGVRLPGVRVQGLGVR